MFTKGWIKIVKFKNDVDVDLVDYMGNDESILRAMLVSTGKDSNELGSDEDRYGRINFLMKNRHGTPFEHAAMTFRISAPIMVFREFHRHRIGWSYNEESGRYKQLEPVFYLAGPNRNLVQTGKPGAYIFEPGNEDQYSRYVTTVKAECNEAYRAYEEMLEDGVAKEVARQILPVNIFSSMYATCNPRSLMAFLSLRTKDVNAMFPSYPMREIEMVAEKMESVFAELFPITYRTYNANGRVCP